MYLPSSLLLWTLPWILPHIKGTLQDKNLIHCNFEQLDLCPFEQDPTDELDWDLYHSPPLSPLLHGPYPDHTYGKVIGHYARLASPPNVTGGDARIMTPNLKLTDGVAELSFYYHMFDPIPSDFKGTINVYGCNRDLVWSRSVNLGNFWVKATIKLSCDSPFRIIFEGVIGAKDSDLAIDDVDVTDRFNRTKPTAGKPMDPRGTEPGGITPRSSNGASTGSITLYPHGELPPVGPGTEDVDPDIALSLVTVAVALFAATCLMLLVTVIIHYKVCNQRRKNHYPSHIVYHGPSYYNRDVERTGNEREGYMTLNFDGSRASSSGTTTELLNMSDRHDMPSKNGDRISLASITRTSSLSEPRPRLPTRRESRTFPIVRELKNLLHAVHMRRIRTLSQHLSVAEIEMLRHELSSRSTTPAHPDVSHDRTMSTILLDTSASTIRPMSEISEHFYYSLFPDPNGEGGARSPAQRRHDARAPLVSGRPAHTSSTMAAQGGPLVDRTGRTVGQSHASSTGEEGTHSTIVQSEESSGPLDDVTSTTIAAGDNTEMVDNEIYESYTENEVSC
ncbi:uncharacterized protein LOC121431346 isoform X2 [Lytechinus variegatus]|uniref:uncharacterized protein LOC121431346 isoform X2 n=1 Tax=Lytechinus variegatus TaxID=7654 RepID=UPI001BB1A5C3|nr:uncharacterized protein LOC121431346 isoform X2 [Lytechinus variegatus]